MGMICCIYNVKLRDGGYGKHRDNYQNWMSFTHKSKAEGLPP